MFRSDHHCIWVNNCIGGNNTLAFHCFLASFVLESLFGAYCMWGVVMDAASFARLWQLSYRDNYTQQVHPVNSFVVAQVNQLSRRLNLHRPEVFSLTYTHPRFFLAFKNCSGCTSRFFLNCWQNNACLPSTYFAWPQKDLQSANFEIEPPLISIRLAVLNESVLQCWN